MLGDKQQALIWLRHAVALGNHNYPWFQRDKNYNNLRNDPEYQKIMEEVRDHIEQCRKAAADYRLCFLVFPAAKVKRFAHAKLFLLEYRNHVDTRIQADVLSPLVDR